MFDINLASYGNKICFITKDNISTYSEVNDICLDIEKELPKEKQLILIVAKVNIETIIGYLSFLRADHAVMILDATIDEKLSKNIINTYKPNLIWEEKEKNNSYIVTYKHYGLRRNNSQVVSLHKDLSLLLSTSGSTGSPKMVKLTKNNLYKNCNSIVQYLNITSDHRAITNLPLYYSYGISILNTHLSQGASIVITDKSIISKEFWKIFKKYRVTTLNGVPYNYEILRRIGFMKMELPSLRFMTQAGGKLNHRLVKEFANWAYKRKIDFFVMYGQTEATARISYVPKEQILKKESSIGISIPGGKLFIKDISSGEIIKDPYIDGELIYQGKNVMMGYATKLKDLSKEDELKGILHTGDIAQKDKDNYFYITGRLKRFIKIHGNRIGLDEIEHYLKSKSYDALCTGIDNKLMIGTSEQKKINEIKKVIIETFQLHHTVVEVRYLQTYPVSNAGKIQYQELIKVFE